MLYITSALVYFVSLLFSPLLFTKTQAQHDKLFWILLNVYGTIIAWCMSAVIAVVMITVFDGNNGVLSETTVIGKFASWLNVMVFDGSFGMILLFQIPFAIVLSAIVLPILVFFFSGSIPFFLWGAGTFYVIANFFISNARRERAEADAADKIRDANDQWRNIRNSGGGRGI